MTLRETIERDRIITIICGDYDDRSPDGVKVIYRTSAPQLLTATLATFAPWMHLDGPVRATDADDVLIVETDGDYPMVVKCVCDDGGR